ncbi:MAG: transposase, partial [Gammaproteobacteria bacterium]|nr:transposase [Gammaproteobacteria bacterium]
FKQEHPDSEAPNRTTVSRTVRRFEETGSVINPPQRQMPKPVRTGSTEQRVLDAVRKSPKKSTRRLSAQIGISKDSVHRILRNAHLKPYRPRLLQGLNEDDPDRRIEFCEWFIQQAEADTNFVDRVIWTDEATFKLNGHINRHNCVYWSDENPHEVLEKDLNSPGVMVWAGTSSSGIIGPFFFQGTVSGDSYLKLITEEVWPEIADWPDLDAVLWQQDGAPPHYSLTVREYLDETFPNRWIGRRGPIDWPPRSPDLTPLDFSVWGIVKEIAYAEKSNNLEEMKEAIQNAFAYFDGDLCAKICHSVVARCEKCITADGGHFENV